MEQQTQPSDLAAYIPVAQYVEQNPTPLVPKRGAAEWIIRHHRRELIECGALIVRKGRAGSLVHREKFPQAIIAIHKRAALAS